MSESRVKSVRAVHTGRGTDISYSVDGAVNKETLTGALSVGQIKRHFHSRGLKCRAKNIRLTKMPE